MIVLILICIILVLILIYHLIWMNKKCVKNINKLPGLNSPSLPIIGNCFNIIIHVNDIYGWYHNKLEKLGGIFRVWILGEPTVVFTSAKYANHIFKSATYVPKGEFYSFLTDWIHLGYRHGVRLDKDEHKKRRKIGAPFLQSPSMLQEFIHVYNKSALAFCQRLKNCNSKEGVEIFHLSLCSSFDVIYETVLGVPGTSLSSNVVSFYQDACDKLIDIAVNRYFMPWLRPNILWNLSQSKREYDKTLKLLSDYADKLILERREKLKNIENDPDYKPKSILDKSILLKDPAVDQDLRYTVNGFIFAGYDTTGTNMAWFLGLMGTYPEIQDKVVEELEEVFGDSGRLPTYEDIDKLKYLDLCVKECLRLFPSLPLIERKLSEDLEIDDYLIPANTTILLFIYGIHRNKEHYYKPNEFIPERFLPENSINRQSSAYVPFSSGDQSCFGQKFGVIEMKCILSTILRKYKIEAVKNVLSLKLKLRIILRPAEGLYIRAIERDNKPYLRVNDQQ